MAKDDYHVIVYQILSYLYYCLKKDIKVVGKTISHETDDLFSIKKNY